jgi:D-3-phosphoglycerate dehydrogenase / 2-oxoglutarate reductase
MKITILDDYANVVRDLPCFRKLAGHDVTVWNDQTTNDDALAERLKDAEILVLLRERTAIRAPLIERLQKLKLISQRNVYPHIDIDACTRRGILVCSTNPPMTAFHSAAELTWGLIIASLRRIPQENAALKNGRWQSSVGLDMRGSMLGIFGYGRIGALLARYAQAFEMKTMVWGREDSQSRARTDGVRIASSRETLFAQSDILAVTIRLNPETTGIVKAGDLARMKPTALFVNTSRAALIEPGALLEALRRGQPGMAALDVFDNESPHCVNDPLVAMDNVVATPHLGYVTHNNLESYFSYAFDQVTAWIAGKPINVVNPGACTF